MPAVLMVVVAHYDSKAVVSVLWVSGVAGRGTRLARVGCGCAAATVGRSLIDDARHWRSQLQIRSPAY